MTSNRPSVKDVTWYTEKNTSVVKVESGDAQWPGLGFMRGCAYRVTVKQPSTTTKKSKTFWGESAWNNAERYASDIEWDYLRKN